MRYIPDHFKLYELVDKATYQQYGSKAWMFFDDAYLQDLDTARNIWGSGLIINNWFNGGNRTQSGLRHNKSPLVTVKTKIYLSGHMMGRAFDLVPSNKKYKDFWNCMWESILAKKFQKFIRIEKFEYTPTWCHLDGLTYTGKPESFVP